MRLFIGVCALAITAGAASAQATDTLHLSRRQTIAEALVKNAQLEVAREQTAQARARRVTSIAIPDPTLTAAFDQEPSPFSLSGAASRPVGLGLTIPFPDKFRLNNRIGVADIRNSESNYRLQQQTVAVQASATYDSLLVALEHRRILKDAETTAKDFLNRTNARYEGGTAAKLDVIQAQVGVAQAGNDLIANERDIATAQASLNRTLGRIASAPIVPTDSLEVPRELPDSGAIVTVALANRPELAMVQHQQEGARASTSLVKEFWLPDLVFAVNRDYAQPGTPLFTTGISLPLPALYWQHAKGDIAQAQHFERELSATNRDTRAQITQ